MANAAATAGRSPDEVTLVAVSKGRTVDQILEAYDAGQRDFGENRADELAEKVPKLPGDIRWHFVGSLQSRKAAVVAPHCQLLHSMDRASLAKRWPQGRPCLLQVNIALEPQKHGVAPADIESALAVFADFGIHPEGLMVIPPLPDRPEASRPWFVAMRGLRDRLAASWALHGELSMGMTDDFEPAIEEGATLIRVGRAIFEAPAHGRPEQGS